MRQHLRDLLAYFGCRYPLYLAAPREDKLHQNFPGVNFFPLPLLGKLSPGADAGSLQTLYRALGQIRPGLLHIHGFKAALIGCPAAALAGVPVIITVHNYLADKTGQYLAPLLNRLMSRVHGRYIAVSKALSLELTARGVLPGQITVIHNGIDPVPFEEAALTVSAPQQTSGKIIVGTVARLAPQKGIINFLRGAALLANAYPEMKFIVAGDGPQRDYLEREADRLGLRKRLQFTGFCRDIPALLACMDIFVLPSLTEGLAIILLEALAARCAVVASKVGGVPEIIEDGVTGLLTPPGEPAALAQQIALLVEKPALAVKLALAGQARVRERFSLHPMLTETEKVYREVLAGEGARPVPQG